MNQAQLLKMPARDYMNADQLAFFKDMLVKDLETAREAARQSREVIADVQVIPDISDWATNEQERHSALRTLERNQTLCKKIIKALERIETGEYGWCEETGEPIGVQRLLLRPTATLCIEAKIRQEALEKHHQKVRGAA